jgi:tetratricopeptide (TPR) repeat protein
MRTYRNDKLGFEMDVPEEWPRPSALDTDGVLFDRTPIEKFNILVGPRLPERLQEYTEFEFRQYIQKQGFTDLDFGRTSVGGRDHVWARYRMGDGTWAKKYMLVFAGIEYAITASSYDRQMFAEREGIWDAVVRSFRLSKWAERDVDFIKSERSKVAGSLYERAYEAIAEGRYSEACALLEQCLRDNPDHILAHKELAFLLKNMGDVRGAIPHRQKVKILDPSDKVNRFNLAGLYFMLGATGDALKEIDELLAMEPNNPGFLELRRIITDSPLTYPQHYDEESRQQPGKKHNLKLIDSIIPDVPFFTHLLLLYHWEEQLSDEEATRLALRAVAFVSCAIYDAAINAGLSCQPSPVLHGRRPAWILEGEKSPVSLILSDIDLSEKTCPMSIGAVVTHRHEPPSDRVRWEKLHTAFKAKFSDICV